jgi:ubiquinone/menaquinone biosynthesis C-methylase UbiE
MDQENAMEMARLLLQDRVITQAMAGLLPDSFAADGRREVLDIACGPGGWVLDVAQSYPTIQVTGIDLDRSLVEYGRVQAAALGLENAHFRVMDATRPLKFADSSFDLINARLLFGFMLPQHWPKLVAECSRILRPGGMLRLTECEAAVTNSAGFEQIAGYLTQALKLARQSFSPTGTTIGITPMLRRFLQDAGFTHLQSRPFVIDWSAGTEAHQSTVENFFVGFQLVQPFLLKMQVASEEQLEQAYEQANRELQADNFCGLWYYLSACGEKPSAAGS